MQYGYLKMACIAGAAIVVAACAGRAARVAANSAYQDEIVLAAASIAEAESAGGAQYASADLNQAREKADAAREAATEGELQLALALAREANLDAQLAAATARNEEMQTALDALEEGLVTLREEVRRDGPGGPASL